MHNALQRVKVMERIFDVNGSGVVRGLWPCIAIVCHRVETAVHVRASLWYSTFSDAVLLATIAILATVRAVRFKR